MITKQHADSDINTRVISLVPESDERILKASFIHYDIT